MENQEAQTAKDLFLMLRNLPRKPQPTRNRLQINGLFK